MDILKQRISSRLYYKLIDANIDSPKLILTTNELALSQLTKLNLEEIKCITQEAADVILTNKFKTALEIPEWPRLITGCDVIDKIIRGGIPVNGITEIFGPSGVGKTQFCLQLSVTVQLPISLGGLNKGAFYICTEDVFPSKRLNQIAKTRPLHSTHFNNLKLEDNIFVEHISDFEQLRRCLYVRLPKLLLHRNIGLIIVDSIAGVFRSENVGVNYTNRSHEFHLITSQLNKLGSEHGIAIVCTNQAEVGLPYFEVVKTGQYTSLMGKSLKEGRGRVYLGRYCVAPLQWDVWGSTLVTDNTESGKSEPCLGLAWSNLITCRFRIGRFVDTVRLFEVVFAPDLPNTNCKFVIKDFGISGIQ